MQEEWFTMKRSVLIVMTVALFAGQASAGLYSPDAGTLATFSFISGTDTGLSDLGRGSLDYTAPNPDAIYGTMQLSFGFIGDLGDSSADLDNTASVTIGTGVALVGYDGFGLQLANDDDDPWSVQVFAVSASGTTQSGFVTLNPNTSVLLTAPTSGTITQIGFDVLGTFVGSSPSNPDSYKISAAPVPIPGAVLLAFLGLGAGGMGLRRLS